MPNKKRYILIIFIIFATIVLFRKDKNHDKNLKIFVTNDVHYLSKSLMDTSLQNLQPREMESTIATKEMKKVVMYEHEYL